LKQQIDDLAKQMEECGILPKGSRSTKSRVVHSSKVEYKAPYARSKHSNKKNGKKVQKDFLPSDYKGDSINNLEGVKQGSMDVLDYTIEFKWQLWKNGLKEDDPRILVYYLLGLNEYIQRVVIDQPHISLEELSSLALDFEEQAKSKELRDKNPHTSQTFQINPTTSRQRHSNPAPYSSQTCCPSLHKTTSTRSTLIHSQTPRPRTSAHSPKELLLLPKFRSH
jgi:hypothetical protein